MATSIQPQPGVPAPAAAQQNGTQPQAAPIQYQVTQENQTGYPRDNLPQNQFVPQQPNVAQQIAQAAHAQQPVQPPQQPVVQLGPDTILSGPGVPAELQGKTMSQAMTMYSGMRQVVLNQYGQPQAAPQVQGLQQPQTQQQPAPQQPAPTQQPPAQQQAFDWRNPDQSIGRIVESRVEQVVQRALAPLIQDRQQQQLGTIVQQVSQRFPDFAQYEPQILQAMQGQDPAVMQNPQAWEAAYYIAKGRSGGLNQAPSAQAQPQSNGVPAPSAAPRQGGYPPQYVGQGQPMPFFTEAPQAPSAGPTTSLSAAERQIAQAMQMSDADYTLWKGGVAR